MKSLFLLLLLLLPQEPIRPARVVIVAENEDLARLFHDELKKRRDVAVVEKDAEFVAYLATVKLEDCAGYTATVLFANADKTHFRLFIADAPNLQLTLERAVAKMDFQLRRIYPSTRH